MARLAMSLDGNPYLFTTASVTTLPTPAVGYEADWSAAWTLASGFFDAASSTLRWTERVRPLDKEALDVTGLTFVLHDYAVTVGPYAGLGAGLLTYLATRSPRVVTSSVLAASISASVLSLTVADGSAFPAGAQQIWIGQEALNITSRAGNVFTVAAGGRGYFASRAVSHVINADRLSYPRVSTAIPWVAKRRAILWLIDDEDTATPLWRGYLGNAPRLHSDGARYSIQAEPAWRLERARTFVDPNVECKLRGHNAKGYRLAFHPESGDAGQYISDRGAASTPDHVYDSAEQYVAAIVPTMNTAIDEATAGATNVHSTLGVNDGALTWTVRADGAGRFFLGAKTGPFGQPQIQMAQASTSSLIGADPHFASTSVEIPEVMVVVSSGPTYGGSVNDDTAAGGQRIPVDRVGGLPTTYTRSTYADAGHITTITPVLAGHYDDNVRLICAATGVTDNETAFPSGGPAVKGHIYPLATSNVDAESAAARVSFENQSTTTTRHEAAAPLLYIDKAVTLRPTGAVRTGHWVYGLKRVIEEASALQSDADSRNWSWDQAATITALIGVRQAAREWWLDGNTRLDDLLTNEALLSGCAIGLRGSRIAPIAIRQPIAGSTVVATLTAADMPVGATCTFDVFEDGIVNNVQVRSGKAKLNVRDADSAADYGLSKPIEIDLTGVPESVTLTANYRELVRDVASRLINLYSDQLTVAKIPVNLSRATTLYHGDVVGISESLLPDLAGGRGLGNATALAALRVAAQRGVIIGREPDANGGVVILDVLLFQSQAAGYSPCVRVESSPALNQITCAAAGYVNGTASYTGTASSGVEYLAAGYRVELIQRDTTLHVTESLVIQSITGETITFTTNIAAGTRTSIGTAGTTWDLRFDDYGTAGLTAAQKPWAWVGGSSVIGGTADPTQAWGA